MDLSDETTRDLVAAELTRGVVDHAGTLQGLESRLSSWTSSMLAESSLMQSVDRLSTFSSGIADRIPELWPKIEVTAALPKWGLLAGILDGTETVFPGVDRLASIVEQCSFDGRLSELAGIVAIPETWPKLDIAGALPKTGTLAGILDGTDTVFPAVDRLSFILEESSFGERLSELAGTLPKFGLGEDFTDKMAALHARVAPFDAELYEPPVSRTYVAQLDDVLVDVHEARAEEREAQLVVPALLATLIETLRDQRWAAVEAESRQRLRDEARDARERGHFVIMAALTALGAAFAGVAATGGF